jgi:hypothetical protein
MKGLEDVMKMAEFWGSRKRKEGEELKIKRIEIGLEIE